MPHFYLHIFDGDKLIEDPEGKEHRNVATAVVEAKEAAREMLADRLRRGEKLDGQRIEITD